MINSPLQSRHMSNVGNYPYTSGYVLFIKTREEKIYSKLGHFLLQQIKVKKVKVEKTNKLNTTNL